MGTRWENGWELGMVAVTLGLAFGCGGKYDIGSGENGGQAGSGTANGGSAESGSGLGGTGTGGVGQAQGGGPETGGVSGSAGTSAGGSSMGGAPNATCEAPVLPLPVYPMASPEVVWDRLCRFLYGETREPFVALPEATTDQWVRERAAAILHTQFDEDGRAPAGLEDFVRSWAFDFDEEADAEFWARSFVPPIMNLSGFFATVGDRVSIMSDRDFLVIHNNSTRRAVWITEELVCNPITPPPSTEIAPLVVKPDQTRREAMEAALADNGACTGCHAVFDPLGFSLEHYDALGNYRTTENGLPIDSSGTYEGSVFLEFTSIDDLAGQLLSLCETKVCFANKLLTHALRQAKPEIAPMFQPAELNRIQNEFVGSGQHLHALIEAIVTTPSFLRE
jgi:hypothetical protein